MLRCRCENKDGGSNCEDEDVEARIEVEAKKM